MEERRIGVALDFSASGKYAIAWALKHLCRKRDHLIIIVVNKKDHNSNNNNTHELTGSPLIPFSDFAEPTITQKYQIQHDIELFSLVEDQKNIKELTVVFKVLWGDARDKICDAATDLSLDCLVIGDRGLTTLKRMFLGSVSNYVVNHSLCPVTVVKLPPNDVHKS